MVETTRLTPGSRTALRIGGIVAIVIGVGTLAGCLRCPPIEWNAGWYQDDVWDRFPSNDTAGFEIGFTPNPGSGSLKWATSEPVAWEERELRVFLSVSEADRVFVDVRPAYSNGEAVGEPDQAMLARLVQHVFDLLGLGHAAIPGDAFYGSSDACS